MPCELSLPGGRWAGAHLGEVEDAKAGQRLRGGDMGHGGGVCEESISSYTKFDMKSSTVRTESHVPAVQRELARMIAERELLSIIRREPQPADGE